MPTVKELQAELQSRGLDTKGKKSELEARLAEHDAQKAAAPAAAEPTAAKESAPAESRKRKADEEPAQAAATKTAKTATQPKKAAASQGNAPVTEFRQDAYGKHQTHTQYASSLLDPHPHTARRRLTRLARLPPGFKLSLVRYGAGTACSSSKRWPREGLRQACG